MKKSQLHQSLSVMLCLCLIVSIFIMTPSYAYAANQFSDVSESDWYYAPVNWAVDQCITGGVSSTVFAPDSDCTREQVVTFL